MTPEEKANDIFKKMLICEETMCVNSALKSSLIAVDEIIETLENERVFESLDYWNEVKAEIKKV